MWRWVFYKGGEVEVLVLERMVKLDVVVEVIYI